jgi:hypothetical protein
MCPFLMVKQPHAKEKIFLRRIPLYRLHFLIVACVISTEPNSAIFVTTVFSVNRTKPNNFLTLENMYLIGHQKRPAENLVANHLTKNPTT